MFALLLDKHPSPNMLLHLRQQFRLLHPDELNIQVKEFLKFMYLQSMKVSGFIPVSDDIDAIWHTYILQTRSYEALCLDLPGKKFVHHQTISLSEYARSRARSDIVNNMLEWIPDYYKHFGEFTETTARYWTIVTFLRKELNLTLQQINALGKW